jgi:hypothetical protein
MIKAAMKGIYDSNSIDEVETEEPVFSDNVYTTRY